MTRLALIDDDPVETLVIEGLLEHAQGDYQVQPFTSVEGFVSAGRDDFDLVMLDRRIPPHDTFASSLKVLAAGPYAGPIVLATAGPCDERDFAWAGPVHGPVDKADLLTPESLEQLVRKAVAAA